MPEPGHRSPPSKRTSKAKNRILRIGLTGFDQGLSSVSNFAVGVAVARVAGVAALGEYSLAYAAWLIVAAMHRSLVTDPMAIENDVNRENAAFHVRVGLAAELTLGVASAVVFGIIGFVLLAAGQHAFGIAFVVFAPFLPFLVAQDYWRWIAFMNARPGKALTNDGVFDVVQAAVFVLLVVAGQRSDVMAIVAWGIGAVAGTFFGLRQFSVRLTIRGGYERLRLRWAMSKWLVASSAAASGASQAGTFLTAGLLGPVGTGGFRAASTLVSGPTNVLVQAGGSIGLPEAARGLDNRGWPGLRKTQRLVTIGGIISVAPIVLVVLLFSKQLMGLVYGHKFTPYWATADVMALSVFVSTFRLGAILSLKTTKQTRLLYHTTVVALISSLALTALLAAFYGVLGAAYAALASSAIVTLATCVLHWRHSRKEAERMYASLGPNAADERLAEASRVGYDTSVL
jgi:O-antigen/teichoic acid export membrane protein